MKRSEVINIIADFVYELNVEPDECNELADKLLTKLENTGMLPPFDPKIHWSNWDITDHGHKWEKE